MTRFVTLFFLLAFAASASNATPSEHEKVFFVARTNSPFWTIYLRNISTNKRESISAHYLSGTSYFDSKLPPGTYQLTIFRKWDSIDILAKNNVQITIFPGCTNYYGGLDLYEEGNTVPGKAVVDANGVLNVDELKNLSPHLKSRFENQDLCVSGEHDDFRFDWDVIKKYFQ